MNINKKIFFFCISSLVSVAAFATPPSPITNLRVMPGLNPGEIFLDWTNPPEAIVGYEIRYRPSSGVGDVISTNSDYNAAILINQPPVNTPPPPPGSPLSVSTLTVRNLTPGAIYAFAMKSYNASSEFSSISNSQAAPAQNVCTAGAGDGTGTAVLNTNTIQAGVKTLVVSTYTVTTSSITGGGIVALRVPDGWNPPDRLVSQSQVGYATVTTNGGASLTVTTSGQMILATINSGPALVAGEKLYFKYQAQTCLNDPGHFKMFSRATSCGVLADIGAGFSNPTVNVVPGSEDHLSFEFGSYNVPINTIVPLKLQVRDSCGNLASMSTSANVALNSVHLTTGGFVSDTAGEMSESSSLAGSFNSGNILLSSGQMGTTIYYRINTLAFSPNNFIEMSWNDFFPPFSPVFHHTSIFPLSSGITNASVDTGTLAAGQTSVTFTPNGDGSNDFSYINFTVPNTSVGWDVKIKQQGTNNVVNQFFGAGVLNPRVTWDGMQMFSPNIAAPGVYNVVISLDGGVVQNTSLSITLDAVGVTGRVVGPGASPLQNAFVDIFGNNGFGHADTGADGTFAIYGLAPGNYTLVAGKNGYVSSQQQITIGASNLAVGDITLAVGSIIRVMATRPSAPVLPELFGNVIAHTADWSKQAHGQIHFQNGSVTSDAGDLWNITPTTYTDLSVQPGFTYTVKLEVPSHGSTNQSVSVLANSVHHLNFALTRRGNIQGTITLPNVVSNPNGVWVSVEAGPDANLDFIFDNNDFTQRYWGGTFINTGQSSSTYRIFGVPNGTYLVEARVPGYIPAQGHATIVGNADATLDFSTFSTGGSLNITLNVTGDSSSLSPPQGSPNNCSSGKVPIGVNVHSRTTYQGNFVEVCLATSTTMSTATGTVSGLANGVYEVFAYIPGFQNIPPGPKFATIAGGVGSITLNFNQFEGILTGAITLPGANVDYSNVLLTLQSYDPSSGDIGAPTITGNTYTFNKLGTGFYNLTAYYPGNGFVIRRGVQVLNDSTRPTILNLDFSGNTYSISGTINTTASSPYNTLSYIVNSSTPSPYLDQKNNSIIMIPANVVFAKRISGGNDDPPNPGGGNMQSSTPTIDTLNVFYATYSTTGAYTIPRLTPGTYRLYNHANMDGNHQNGNEIAEISRIVHVINSNLTGQNITLIDGYNVSGTLRLDAGLQSESGRNIQLRLVNNSGVAIKEKTIFFSGTSISYSLTKVPPGDFKLEVLDMDYPRKYSAKNKRVVVVSGHVTNVDLTLLQTAKITGKLSLKNSGVLLTSNNYSQILPNSFSIFANANPWFPGGHGNAEHPIIGSDDKFTLNLNPGIYDLRFEVPGFIGDAAIAQGQKQFVNVRIAGIEVQAGQTIDLGIVELVEGIKLVGTVKDVSGNALSNIPVEAFPVDNPHDFAAQAFTNHLGQYQLHGLDPNRIRFYNIEAAPRPDGGDDRYQGFSGPLYGEVRRAGIDMQKVQSGQITSVDFTLERALASVSGTVVTPDGGDLLLPFEENGQTLPGALIIMNKVGNIPTDNPLGDIEERTNFDGTFNVKGLVAGTYDIWVLAKGYGSVFRDDVSVINSGTNLGTLTLTTGHKLSGTLTRSDGSFLNERETDVMVGVESGNFQNVVISNFITDADGAILSYEMSGFVTGKSYDLLLFANESNDFSVVASGISLSENKVQNFIVRHKQPDLFLQVSKLTGGNLELRLESTIAFRNSNIDENGDGIPDDSAAAILKLKTGAGTLSFGANPISPDRKKVTATYAPAAGEISAVFTANGKFVTNDPATGQNFSRTKDFTVLLGIARTKSKQVSNTRGAELQLENDTSKFGIKPGTFGDNSTTQVTVKFSAADNVNGLTGSGVGAMAQFEALGPQAYPTGIAKAMSKIRDLAVNPFSSFYEIFLPATVSHSFPEGKEAQLCLNYDSSVTDPSALNIYFFNEQSSEYLLESKNKLVDTENTRICVSLSHASVFTVLASSDAIIGGSGYTGQLNIINFPNPFDLKPKSITLQNPGSATASQSINGTMIKFSIPQNVTGPVEIEIFDVTGEKVRTLQTTAATAGTHYYLEWNGRNQRGKEVASGTYIARFTIAGQERFFKMVVLK